MLQILMTGYYFVFNHCIVALHRSFLWEDVHLTQAKFLQLESHLWVLPFFLGGGGGVEAQKMFWSV